MKSLIHRHMPITRSRIDKVLCNIKSKRRTQQLASILNSGQCYCKRKLAGNRGEVCSGDCQTAYSCFYNSSETHPFLVTEDDQSYYFADLYPHLGKLERLSKEMKEKYRGYKPFESIADMVFNILVRYRFSDDSLYQGLGDVIHDMKNSSLSLYLSLS